ncbi:MAG: PLP-dependent cysteine synthase family protein [Hadesarchaea archaeon]|nr:PLP-dependent cysteine synthase family protein [Hadesarchaea archaeon]
MIQWDKNKDYHDNILEAIGRTPLVNLNEIPGNEDVNASILGKIEWFSPTGSLKDRIFYEMITKAIEKGELEPGMEIIEASTGNAGIACSFVGGLLGYDVTIIMPEGMSKERIKIMEAYGANVELTPGAESDVDICLERVKEKLEENPDKYWWANQYENPDNINAHYKTTGKEIWEQTNGEVEAFLATQGTGGTITGVGKYLKEKDSSVKIYAGEPKEAPMLSKREWGAHRIEGIGDGFVPRNLDLSQLTGIFVTSSDEAIEMAQRLAREEGIFCGISSGSNVAGAVKLAKERPELETIVTMINDTGQRYYSTPLCGEEKELDVPERDHPMDEYTIEQLNDYQSDWEIIK